MSSVKYQKNDKNIVHLVLDKDNSPVNIMDEAFRNDWHEAITKLKGDKPRGVVISSKKKTFFAGGDLKALKEIKPEEAEQCFNMVEGIKADFRALETLGVPVVAAINGPALGGGWEIALSCHHRIAIDHLKVKVGLPEVSLGLLPGAGGVTRMVRLMGLEAAFPFIMEGKQIPSAKAKDLGLVHELCQDPAELLNMAEKHILANETASQPWDVKGYKIPGGTPLSPKLAMKLVGAPAMLKQKTKGCYPAPEAILATAVEGANVNFDTATRIESRYFTQLATGQVAKNMIETFFFQLNDIHGGFARPKESKASTLEKVGVIGSGMMGAGIAYSCAVRGINVALKDVDVETAAKGKAYSEKILSKRIKRGTMSEEKAAGILEKITPTGQYEDFADCDLIIEAVFENRDLKATVTKESEGFLKSDGVFSSNTSTLPITGLAKASKDSSKFIGIHFFSPVDKMPLVEIIRGKETSDETLAKAFDFVRQINKTPIVVNDSRGFFTSRVFGTFTKEGAMLLSEGVDPAIIENGALQAGMPIGPLAVTDEVSLKLVESIRAQTEKDLKAEGVDMKMDAADNIVAEMVGNHGRAGKLAGEGFYDYPKGGKKKLWEGLYKNYVKDDVSIPMVDIKERFLFRQAIETVRCLEEGVLTSVKEANIGSIFGIGFAAWTGGAIQYINQYGVREFTVRAKELAETYGERFTPPKLLIEKAETEQLFVD